MKQLTIGVFDSGVGGLSVANAVKKALPEAKVVLKEDKEHLPYGDKPIEEIYSLCKPILVSLVKDGCQLIVIACNTVTTNLINRLRGELPVPLIGIEPMVKPAAIQTKSGVIAVCATPRTLSSQRYQWLKQQYAKNVKVLEPDCSDWAQMIETNRVDRAKISRIVNEVCSAGADQIVLGCTHYHWIDTIIKQSIHGRARVIHPEEAVIAQLKRVLTRIRL